VNDDVIYDLVRDSLADLAGEARPVHLRPEDLRPRRRRLPVAVGALCVATALVVAIPVARAAGPGGGAEHLPPTGQPSVAEPTLSGPVAWTPSVARGTR
jgi:hypothetical protein